MEPEFDAEMWELANRPLRDPKTITCRQCGRKVVLETAWANECEGCGTEYNGSGQRLAPRSQWGEETGERF